MTKTTSPTQTQPSQWMQAALDLSSHALPKAWPRPTVGAVVIHDDEIVGRGVTQPNGGLHAEIMALQDAGQAARNSHMYLTLEPHGYQSTQPPCTDAIIQAGVTAVTFAVNDPNPKVAGTGARQLIESGLQVNIGDGGHEASELHEAFFHFIQFNTPFVAVKFAATLDGKIASSSGDSQWVSGEIARNWSHQLRTEIQSIAVGSGTILADDPKLTARPHGKLAANNLQPLRAVFDSRGRISPESAVLGDNTIILTTESSTERWRSQIAQSNSSVLVVDKDDSGRVDINSALKKLGALQIQNILFEGGAEILGSLFDRKLVNRVHAVLAPAIMGGGTSPNAVLGHGAWQMNDVTRLNNIRVQSLGDDIHLTGIPCWPESK
jgi:diaminohydroxyphosphoribosylaminopyrimidine deaminase/5-amino-6-(5-phosphoribosylamino)uracil reductase